MADGIMCSILASPDLSRCRSSERFEVIVADGLLPFLRSLTRTPHDGVSRPVIGVLSGELPASVASRLPSKTHLITTFSWNSRGEQMHGRLQHAAAASRNDLTVARWCKS